MTLMTPNYRTPADAGLPRLFHFVPLRPRAADCGRWATGNRKDTSVKRIAIGLMMVGMIVQSASSANIDTTALKQLQGEWIVEEWTGYTLLGLYEASTAMAPSKDKIYSGSTLKVSGTNTIWQLKVPQEMKELLLGPFSQGKDLVAKKEGDIKFYVDKASIVALEAGKPGKMRFAGIPGEGPYAVNEYTAIWSLKSDRLVICKAKNPGEKCSGSLEIPQDDFSNTRIVLRRAEKGK